MYVILYSVWTVVDLYDENIGSTVNIRQGIQAALTSGVVWQILYLTASGVARTQYGHTTSTEATRGSVRGCFTPVVLNQAGALPTMPQ